MKAVETASEKDALCLGKPNAYAFELMNLDHAIGSKKCLMIGDNLDTDIMFAKNAGIDSLLVLSGVTSEEKYDQS